MRERTFLHVHGHAQIIYVLSGTLKHTINNQTYIQHPGSCAFILPYTPHITDLTESEDTPVVAFISFYDSFMLDYGYNFFPYGNESARFEGRTIPSFYEFSGKRQTDATKLIRDMIAEFSLHEKMSYKKIAAQVAEFLRLLCIDTAKDCDIELLSERVAGIRRVIKYIEEHYHEKLTIEKLCPIAAMSRCMFTRHFKEITGMTFSHYLLSLRLQKASALLKGSDLNLNQIAKQTGLNDKTHLSHMFSKSYGMTPMEFKSLTSPLQKESQASAKRRWKWIEDKE